MKLAGTLPKGDLNGLEGLDGLAATSLDLRHVVIAVIAPKKLVTDTDTGETEVHMRLVRVERILANDADAAEKLMRRAISKRFGQTTLPLDLEDDIVAIFKDAKIAADVTLTLSLDDKDEPEQGTPEPKEKP